MALVRRDKRGVGARFRLGDLGGDEFEQEQSSSWTSTKGYDLVSVLEARISRYVTDVLTFTTIFEGRFRDSHY